MRITLMHNPKAGSGRHRKKELLRALAEAGHHAIYYSTKEADYEKGLKKPTDLILVAGGDGTVGKIACRLIDTGIPMAVLPLGTANNLARTLGFMGSPEQITGCLESGEKHAFDVGVIRMARETKYFFESVGGGLFADYVKAATRKRAKKSSSNEQEMIRHVALLRQMLHDYRPQEWEIQIDGEDASDQYILWEAMNIRSVGPALYLAPFAATKDGRFDFVSARESDSAALIEHLDARLAGKKNKFPLPTRRFQKLRIACGECVLRVDGKVWPGKNKKMNDRQEIEITVKPSALVILRQVANPRI